MEEELEALKIIYEDKVSISANNPKRIRVEVSLDPFREDSFTHADIEFILDDKVRLNTLKITRYIKK